MFKALPHGRAFRLFSNRKENYMLLCQPLETLYRICTALDIEMSVLVLKIEEDLENN